MGHARANGIYEDNFAAVFNLGGVTLRISAVTCFTPHEHTILASSRRMWCSVWTNNNLRKAGFTY
jgi:hypothetical protein